MKSISEKPSVFFFCKFPPPYTGQSIGTETFADLLSGHADVRRIDTSCGIERPDVVGVNWFKYYAAQISHLAESYTELNAALRRRQPDVFYYVASPSLLGHFKNIIALSIARPYVGRIVAHVHNGNFPDVFDRPFSRRSSRWLAEKTDTFIFSSELLSERAGNFIPFDKRRVVHNTVDEQVLCSDKEISNKIAEAPQRKRLNVLFLSNMIPSKGYMDVACAIELLDRSKVKLNVDFVGDWIVQGRREEFTAFIRQHNLDHIVEVHGQIANREVIKNFLVEADVFVLPTYYPNEAQPFAIIEAMNAGTPVIATPHASIPEYVTNENGYLVNKKSPQQIAQAIEALSDVKNWKKKAQAARSTYERKFSPDAVGEQFVESVLTGGK